MTYKVYTEEDGRTDGQTTVINNYIKTLSSGIKTHNGVQKDREKQYISQGFARHKN